MGPIERIFERFDRHGGNDYGGEQVRQLEHALQSAAQAEAESASPALVTAALLHDIGHLIHDLGDSPENNPEIRPQQDRKFPTRRVLSRRRRVISKLATCYYATRSRCQESDRRFLQVTYSGQNCRP